MPPHLSCCVTISVFDCWSHKGAGFFHVIKAITVIILNLSFLKGARTNEGGFAYKLSLDVGGNHSRPARQTDEAVRRHYKGAWDGDTLLCSPLLVTLWGMSPNCLADSFEWETVWRTVIPGRSKPAPWSAEETCGRPPLPRARPFPRRYSDLPTAPLRAVPLRNGSCPTLCFWVYHLTSGAGAPASDHGGVRTGAGEPGSQVAVAGLGPVLHPKKGVRSPVQVFVVQKSKVRRTVGFKAGLSGNRVGFWAREAICNVPVSHHGCISLHKAPYVSRDRGRVFLALKNAMKNIGNIPIFSLALSFVTPVTAKQSVPPWRSVVWREHEHVALSRDSVSSQLTHCHLQHYSCWKVPAHQHPEAIQPFDFKSEHW